MDEHADAQSFVVRVWIEERDAAGGPSVWRGHVTNVLDRRRRSIDDFDQLVDFIAAYVRRDDRERGPT